MDNAITEAEILLHIQELKNNKRPGPDSITNNMIKSVQSLLVKPIKTLFNKIYSETEYPNDWKISLITPIYKKGKFRDPNN